MAVGPPHIWIRDRRTGWWSGEQSRGVTKPSSPYKWVSCRTPYYQQTRNPSLLQPCSPALSLNMFIRFSSLLPVAALAALVAAAPGGGTSSSCSSGSNYCCNSTQDVRRTPILHCCTPCANNRPRFSRRAQRSPYLPGCSEPTSAV